MRLKLALLLLICSFPLLSGCGSDSAGPGSAASLRVANLVLGTTSLGVTVGTTSLLSGAAFESVNGYTDVAGGDQEFKVSVAGGTSNLLDTIYNVSTATHQTFIAYGTTAAAAGVLLTDEFTAPGTSDFVLRLVNAAPTVGAIDIYITTLTKPTADLGLLAPNIAGVIPGTASEFATFGVGTYRIRITRGGTKEVIFDQGAPRAAQGIGQTLVAYSRGSAGLVNLAVLGSDNGSSIVSNGLARFKVINASSVASPLNVFVDDSPLPSGLPYAAASSYQNTMAGVRKFTVEATATPGTTLFTMTQALAAAQDASIVLTGSAGSLAAIVLADTNIPVNSGSAQVRFVNAADGNPAFDIYVNFGQQVGGLAPRSASAYQSITASTSGTVYEFEFKLAGTATAVLKVPAVTLTTGHIYTVYLAGPAASPQAVVTQDL